MRNFHKLNIDTRGQGSGRVKTFCPFCHETRHNKRDRSLSVDIDKGLYLCHYCGAKGYVPDEAEERARELRRLQREQKAARQTTAKRYVLPTWHPEFMQLPEEIATYLTCERKISLETARRLRVSAPFAARPQTQELEELKRVTASNEAKELKPIVSAMIPTNENMQAAHSALTPNGAKRSDKSFDSSNSLTSQRVLAFNYFHHDRLINVKTRTLDKQFTLVRGAELIPYNVDAIEGKAVCYITEGEFDTLTLVECGFPEAISVPGGGNSNLSWMDRFVETHFEDKQQIVLALDNDAVGLKLRDELTRRLG